MLPNGPSLPSRSLHGRGTASNPHNRFEALAYVADPDLPPEEAPAPKTRFYRDVAGAVIAYNESPDLGFSASLNVYRGCEHGCAYCFARPFHEYLGFSAGLDFETKVLVKTNAPDLLRQELAAPNWKPQTVMMSGATDCYQPAERQFKLTRECLKVFAEFRNSISIITKSHLVTRDIPLLVPLARLRAARVFLSITTLNPELASRLEPRAASPAHRLRALRELAAAGIPAGVMVAPVIPGLTDSELPRILEAAKAAGASFAGYTLLRLPYAVKDIFGEWLDQYEPGKKDRILDRLRRSRGGRLYDAAWSKRHRGEGFFAEQLAHMFAVVARRLGLEGEREPLSTADFQHPGGKQMALDF
jgi:DNA repair photolyase